MCTPDMVWRPKQELSHEKRCLLDGTIDGNVPALPPLGPEHPRLFNPSPTTQRPYSQTPPPRPTHPTTYTRPPTYKPTYGAPRARPLGPSYNAPN
jgi:hypothetical protein